MTAAYVFLKGSMGQCSLMPMFSMLWKDLGKRLGLGFGATYGIGRQGHKADYTCACPQCRKKVHDLGKWVA